MSIEQVQGNRRQRIGALGERVAAEYLVKTLGWTVLHRNWRCREGEIDIAALDGESLVAVEVRTRASVTAGSAVESVDLQKRRQLLRLTQRLLADPVIIQLKQAQFPADELSVRIDVIGLFSSPDTVSFSDTISGFVHIRNAVDGP